MIARFDANDNDDEVSSDTVCNTGNHTLGGNIFVLCFYRSMDVEC